MLAERNITRKTLDNFKHVTGYDIDLLDRTEGIQSKMDFEDLMRQKPKEGDLNIQNTVLNQIFHESNLKVHNHDIYSQMNTIYNTIAGKSLPCAMYSEVDDHYELSMQDRRLRLVQENKLTDNLKNNVWLSDKKFM